MLTIDFTTPPSEQPLAINWRARVEAYLATEPNGDPALWLAIIEGAFRGELSGTWARQKRLEWLMKAAHDDRGYVTLVAQLALLDVLRVRAM